MGRFKEENTFVVTVLPGPKKPYDLFSFLFPLIKDLMVLESKGLVVETSSGEQFKYQVVMSTVIGDLPAIAEIAGHHSHSSYTGCRICHITGTYKRGMYFPHIDEFGEICQHAIKQIDEYKALNTSNTNEVSLI